MPLALDRPRAVILALALSAAPAPLVAQATTGTIRGRVVDAASGRPLPDAQVAVEGTRLGAMTSAAGEFTVAAVPAGPRTVTVRRIGYQPGSQAVAVTAGAAAAVEFRLNVSALNLSEVVVTGSAAPTERRKVGTSIASVDSTVIARAQSVTVDQALQGKVPGAQITQNSGGRAAGGSRCACAAPTRSSRAPTRSTSSTG
jgi:hypothetical protein